MFQQSYIDAMRAQIEAQRINELHKRAGKGDKFAQRELRKIENSEAAGLLTALGVIGGGIALGAASTIIAPVALGAGLIAKGITYFNTK